MLRIWLSTAILAGFATCLRGETIATYELVFTRLWTQTSHPTDYPSNRHFSGLGGATHTSEVSFWEPGGLASRGVENVAEAGSKTALSGEVTAAIADGTAGSWLNYGGISGSRVTRTETFEIRESFPQLTIISMVAPSPDWFVGISGVDLRESDWTQSAHFDLYPYDAGTDSGITFTSPNQATVPPEPIYLLDTFPFAGTGPVASFDLQLLSVEEYVPPPPPPEVDADFNGDGMVDGDDFLIWQTNFPLPLAATKATGDADGDGDVDGGDFLGWQAQFGSGLGGGGRVAVPEPATGILTILALAAAIPLRRLGR